jgi:NADH-quinone oxidoreductase subunit E
MADRSPQPDSPELRARWGSFEFSSEYKAKADKAIARYPEGRQKSAVMPLLDLAQRQVGEETDTQGWLPIPVIEYVAAYLGMPAIRVLEVATFYFMYNLVPVGKYHVQVCGTTPCMLRGSDALFETCAARGMVKGHVSADGLWTLTEVECMGNCATAPMVQINDDNFEDLDTRTARCGARCAGCGRKPQGGDAGAGSSHQRAQRRTVDPQGNGRRQPRLSERMVMDIVTIAIAVVAIIIAWKVLAGLAKTLALLVILAIAAFVVFGGVI